MQRSAVILIALCLLAGKAHAQEREWSLDASDQEAYLIFGVPETDDVGVSLWCPVKKGVVNFFVPRPTEELKKIKSKKVSLTVKAGAETATFAGKIDVNTESLNSSVEAEIPVDHPLFKALETADRFDVKVGAADVVFPLYDADIAGLLDRCRK